MSVDLADRGTRAHVARLANPATLGGTVAVAVGLVLVLVPSLSVGFVQAVAALGLLTTGLTDLWAVVRRRGLRPLTRTAALLRGLGSLALALTFLLSARDALEAAVVLGAAYLLLRSLINLVLAAFGAREHRGPRLASGGVGAAFALAVLASPGVYVDWIAVAVGLLALLGGGVTLAYGYRVATGAVPAPEGAYPSLTEILWSWIEQADVGPARRSELADELYLERPERAAKRLAWWTMLVLSVFIATLAVLQDSTAVVIGAMLVAPLMTPILGLAGALVNGWRMRAVRSLLLVAAGVAVAVVLAYAIAAWVPAVVPVDSNSQVSSRIDPTLLDMLIAIAAGAAGAFATVNKRVASSLGGVAIAVALVPPLSVVGVTLGAGRPQDAVGAFLLFATNFVSIVLAASVVFVLAGVPNPKLLLRRGRQVLVTLAPFVAAALLILVPLLVTTDGLLDRTANERAAQGAVTSWLGDGSTLEVRTVTVAGGTVTVELTGPPDDLPAPATLQRAVDDALGDDYALEISVVPVTTTRLPAG
ncbi:DUF389 domain-containing protein [Isoptericola sp. BMS4]|uniref:DUF389 domain-containing protein n=1 Tax=Isoptericola sp. BMS4 TaxID=2527875 RepID=UPI00141DA1B9|nr:DUF389 domain-containing protein [Isoptericola sp. BMS4]